MNQFTNTTNNNTIKVSKADKCNYLLSPITPSKTHTLVLDIDETLLSVRRWIDEVQINDPVLHTRTNQALVVTKITKEVTLHYDDTGVSVYSFYFTQESPFGQLQSSLDIGDRMDIGQRLASVKEVFTSYITVYDAENDTEMDINCASEQYLNELQYMDVTSKRDTKFSAPDLVYNNTYLVRFRIGLASFFKQMRSHPSLEIVLWTAAVRKVYTGLMREVAQILLARMGSDTALWDAILFRDNCSQRENGTYFKDLALLDRDYASLIMVDNIAFNFEGFEYNGLPINEYWGHSHDDEMFKLCDIISEVMRDSCDIRQILHSCAFKHQFSTFKLDQMLNYLKSYASVPVSSQSISDINDSVQSESDRDGADSTPSFTESLDETLDEASDLEFYLFNLSMDNITIEDMFDVDPNLLKHD